MRREYQIVGKLSGHRSCANTDEDATSVSCRRFFFSSSSSLLLLLLLSASDN